MNFVFLIIFQLLIQNDWGKLTSDDHKFSIMVPPAIEWVKNSNPIETELGKLDLVIYKSKDKDEINNRYLLSYIDYDPEILLDDAIKDSMILESAFNLPGELIYQNSSSNDGIKNMLLRKKITAQDTYLKAKLFFVENRFYMLIVYSETTSASNKRIDKFLNSFRLIKQTNQ